MPYNKQAAIYPRGDRGFDVGLRDLIAHLPKHIVMAEVGVFSGAGTRIFLDSGKVSWLYAVDAWQDYTEDGVLYWSPFTWQDVQDTFAAGPGADLNVETLHISSQQAAAQRPDGELDFVYIDASHAYADIKADLEAWLPKVRARGWIGGNDYTLSDTVRQAVDELGLGEPLTFSDSSWLLRLPKAAAPKPTPVEETVEGMAPPVEDMVEIVPVETPMPEGPHAPAESKRLSRWVIPDPVVAEPIAQEG